ncbi:MAG: carbohydrate ABC transporter permease [Ruminococcaceae bacterium]|nr:carbohydrate ABC transporter permease [Oscillospiraceae bacterium]
MANTRKISSEGRVFPVINGIIMSLILLTTLYPFWYCIVISFNDGTDALKGGFYLFPRIFTWENYEFIFQNSRLLTGFRNSVLRTVSGTLLHIGFTGIVAYGLSKKQLHFRKAYMFFILLTMYFSGGMIPQYLLIKNLGMLDNFLVYIIPTMFGVYNAILFISYYESIPESLEESATIDGAGKFVIFFRIIIPCSIPIFATIALFQIVSQWNSWFDTVIYTRSDTLVTLQSIMAKMVAEADAAKEMNEMVASGGGSSKAFVTIKPVTIRVATMIVTTFPITVAYPFLQKYFIKGIMLGSVKG